MADNRLKEAIDDISHLLAAGITSSPAGRCSSSIPRAPFPDSMIEPLRSAAAAGGVSLWVNGIDPGFANDWLPLVLTSVCERIDEIRCFEILNYATYDQAW